MDYLRTYAEELGLADILPQFTERENVQGAVLTLDDWWLTAWKLAETGQMGRWERWWREWRHYLPMPVPPPIFGMSNQGADDAPWIPMQRPDLNWRPPYWEEYSYFTGMKDMPPVRLIICLTPPATDEKPRGFDFGDTRLPVSFEVRPIARLANQHRGAARPIVGGVSVGSGPSEFGTLGGVVRDGSGTRFGATCAHVFPSATSVDQPAKRDDASASGIGMSTPVVPLQHCTSLTPCGAYSTAPHIAEVDTALIDLNLGVAADLEVLAIGPMSGVVAKNSMSPRQSVEFAGRTSGHRFAELGGLGLFYRLKLGTKTYCFRNVFEVRWKNFLRTILGPVVRGGDSGAWVCAATAQGVGWCGQIIGEDRHIGYAAFAENTVEAWRSAGHQLDVV